MVFSKMPRAFSDPSFFLQEEVVVGVDLLVCEFGG